MKKEQQRQQQQQQHNQNILICLVSLPWRLEKKYYRKTSSISRTLVGNKIVDKSDVVGASPVGAAPTTSSFST